MSTINLIAVTVGPGLEPALWTGIEFAKKLSTKLNVPLVGANHLEGHLYAGLLPSTREIKNEKLKMKNVGIAFPAIVLLVSGGHTMLLLMKDLLHWKMLGETRDDAVGEAFDKVARILGLPYPGGPEIEKLALRHAQGKLGNPKGTINFPRPMMRDDNYDFSFSGLKTAVLYYARNHALHSDPPAGGEESHKNPPSNNYSLVCDVAASFQAAAIDVLTSKTIRAVREFGAKSVLLCGGVAANIALRDALKKSATIASAQFVAPATEYNTDNAAMIAAAAYMGTMRKQRELPMEANGNLTL